MKIKQTRREFLGVASAWIALGALPLQAQAGRVATIVGVGTRGTAADGDAVETAQINNPYGVIEDAARSGLYWVDNSTHRILKLDYRTKKLSLVAARERRVIRAMAVPRSQLNWPSHMKFISTAKAISISSSETLT